MVHHRVDRTDFHAVLLGFPHINEKAGNTIDTLFDLIGRRRAGEKQHHIRMRSSGNPDLLAVDDVTAVVAFFCLGLQLRGVRSGRGLSHTKRLQAQFAASDFGQEFFLLFITSVPKNGAHRIHLRMASSGSAAIVVHRFKDYSAGPKRQTPPPVLLGNKGRQISGVGQRLHELRRIAARWRLIFDIAPILGREFLAEVRNTLS